MEILEKVGCIRRDQLLTLLRGKYQEQTKTMRSEHLTPMLQQLVAVSRTVCVEGNIIRFSAQKIDPLRLEAIDVMLEITGGYPLQFSRPSAVSSLLCFLYGDDLAVYYVVPLKAKVFHSVRVVLSSPFTNAAELRQHLKEKTDQVMHSTKLEDSIYQEMRNGDEEIDTLEANAGAKLKSFPALPRDVFQSLYALVPRRNAEENLSTAARKFNAHILDYVVQQDDYPALKSICEGRSLPAYEAAAELTSRASDDLDALLSELGGDKGALNNFEKLEAARNAAAEDLADLLDAQANTSVPNELRVKALVETASRLASKQRQVEAVSQVLDVTMTGQSAAVAQALSCAPCVFAIVLMEDHLYSAITICERQPCSTRGKISFTADLGRVISSRFSSSSNAPCSTRIEGGITSEWIRPADPSNVLLRRTVTGLKSVFAGMTTSSISPVYWVSSMWPSNSSAAKFSSSALRPLG